MLNYAGAHHLRNLNNIIIDGNNRTSSGVFVYQCNRVGFENVTVKNISWDNNTNLIYCYGIEVMACEDVLFDKCIIEDVKATPTSHVAAGIAVNVSEEGVTSKNITIKNCRIGRIWSDNNGVGLGADCVVLAGRYDKERDINALIDHCEFYDFTKRAVKAQAENVRVENCTFSLTPFMNDKEAPKYVIEMFGSHSMVSNNRINLKGKGCYIGVGIYAGGNALVRNENVMFDESDITQDVVIKNNVIIADHLTYGVFVGISDTNDANLYRNITIASNLIKGNKKLFYGIRSVDSIEDGVLEENIIDNASVGIWLNSIEKSVRGVCFIPKYKNVIIRNNRLNGAGDNKQFGVGFDNVNNSRIVGNTINGFNSGVILGTASSTIDITNCNIDGNTISDCSWGIESNDRCYETTIQNNLFERNKLYDMVLQSDKSRIHLMDNINVQKVLQEK